MTLIGHRLNACAVTLLIAENRSSSVDRTLRLTKCDCQGKNKLPNGIQATEMSSKKASRFALKDRISLGQESGRTTARGYAIAFSLIFNENPLDYDSAVDSQSLDWYRILLSNIGRLAPWSPPNPFC
jgi:hypothetical protein